MRGLWTLAMALIAVAVVAVAALALASMYPKAKLYDVAADYYAAKAMARHITDNAYVPLRAVCPQAGVNETIWFFYTNDTASSPFNPLPAQVGAVKVWKGMSAWRRLPSGVDYFIYLCLYDVQEVVTARGQRAYLFKILVMHGLDPLPALEAYDEATGAKTAYAIVAPFNRYYWLTWGNTTLSAIGGSDVPPFVNATLYVLANYTVFTISAGGQSATYLRAMVKVVDYPFEAQIGFTKRIR